MKSEYLISFSGIDHLVSADFFSKLSIEKTELVGNTYFITIAEGYQISIYKDQYHKLKREFSISQIIDNND